MCDILQNVKMTKVTEDRITQNRISMCIEKNTISMSVAGYQLFICSNEANLSHSMSMTESSFG